MSLEQRAGYASGANVAERCRWRWLGTEEEADGKIKEIEVDVVSRIQRTLWRKRFRHQLRVIVKELPQIE